MRAPPARWPLQVFRVASLAVPSALAWGVVFSSAPPSSLRDVALSTLAPVWGLTAIALAGRSVAALRRDEGLEGASVLDRIDLLTASGSAMAWASALAVALSAWVGWASLAVVGLLGTAVVHAVVLRTCLLGSGARLIRRGHVARRFLPEVAVEGATVTEELTVSAVAIPAGFRLFASGAVGPRWPVARYALTDAEAGGEVVVEAELGPAVRGDHHAPPLALWLEDAFGLTHTPRVRLAPARLTVLPRPHPVDGARLVLGRGRGALTPREARRLATEGSLRLREHQPGDDARRIHWVRSLSAQQIVVRLPDEIPPEEPSVRLVLGTFLPGADALEGASAAELLDALVAVWLGVGRALLEAGARVTLVTAAGPGRELAPHRCRLTAHTFPEALRLGAAARWQSTVPLAALLDDGPAVVVSCRVVPAPEGHGPLRWILVPPPAWTALVEAPARGSRARHPFPPGSADNRWSRRRRERLRREGARRDHAALGRVTADLGEALPGTLVARPVAGPRVALTVLR